MTDKSKPQGGKPRIEKLELNKETLEGLTESEAEAAAGGLVPRSRHPGCETGNQKGCPPPSGARPYTCHPSCGRACTGECGKV